MSHNGALRDLDWFIHKFLDATIPGKLKTSTAVSLDWTALATNAVPKTSAPTKRCEISTPDGKPTPNQHPPRRHRQQRASHPQRRFRRSRRLSHRHQQTPRRWLHRLLRPHRRPHRQRHMGRRPLQHLHRKDPTTSHHPHPSCPANNDTAATGAKPKTGPCGPFTAIGFETVITRRTLFALRAVQHRTGDRRRGQPLAGGSVRPFWAVTRRAAEARPR